MRERWSRISQELHPGYGYEGPSSQLIDHRRLQFLVRFRQFARRRLELGQHVLDAFGHQKTDGEAGADELQLFHVVEQRAEWIPEMIDIGDQDRLLVAAELRPGELLDQLPPPARPAR